MAAELPRSILPLAIEPDPDDLARVASDLLVLGRRHPDRAIAKAARKAARHARR